MAEPILRGDLCDGTLVVPFPHHRLVQGIVKSAVQNKDLYSQ